MVTYILCSSVPVILISSLRSYFPHYTNAMRRRPGEIKICPQRYKKDHDRYRSPTKDNSPFLIPAPQMLLLLFNGQPVDHRSPFRIRGYYIFVSRGQCNSKYATYFINSTQI